MSLRTWLGRKKRERTGWTPHCRETVAFDVIQRSNEIELHADGLCVRFTVEGVDLPCPLDHSFAVWSLMPTAMTSGFDIRLNHPIDPEVAKNAERLSQIWEMWMPDRYRSIRVRGTGKWTPRRRQRMYRVQLFSGGVDSTFVLMQQKDPNTRGHVLTVRGHDYHGYGDGKDFAKLIAKTAPLLDHWNYDQIIISTDAKQSLRLPAKLTHTFTLAGCLFLLRDLFGEGAIAADFTHAQDFSVFPYSNNQISNRYFSGSDFAMRTIGTEHSRIEKLAAIAADPAVLASLSFCGNKEVHPSNCGACDKCIRTKAALVATTGSYPDIFIDKGFTERHIDRLNIRKRTERTHLLDIYHHARDRGTLGAIPGLNQRIEEIRRCKVKIK